MKTYFTPTFFRFLVGFLIILAVAFSVMIFASKNPTKLPVDSEALPG